MLVVQLKLMAEAMNPNGLESQGRVFRGKRVIDLEKNISIPKKLK